MLVKNWRMPFAVVCGAVLVACGANPTGTSESNESTGSTRPGGYAERTYAVFAEASQGALQVQVSTLRSGRMSELRGQHLQGLLTPPSTVLAARAVGDHINSVWLTERASDEAFFGDGLVDHFEENGHPLDQGTYRLLAVTATVGDRSVDYRSLEAHWADFDIVADPVIEQVDAFGQIHVQLTQRGWSIQHAPLVMPELRVTSSVCALASNHSWGGESLTWGSYHSWWSDVFGLHLVDFYLGGQQAGISCSISGGSCVPNAYGYSNDSSCSAILGYSCACKNTGLTVGRTGNRMAVATETECDYKNPLSGSASVSYSKGGIGASLTIDWSTHGAAAESYNGGELVNTCGWY
jgi:hypothetical protein